MDSAGEIRVKNLQDYLDRPNLITWGLTSGDSFLVRGEGALVGGSSRRAAAGFKDGGIGP